MGLGLGADSHDVWVIERLLSVRPNKRTVWWMLGDITMESECLKLLDQVPGDKVLVLGNHDKFDIGLYAKHFYRIHGIRKHFGFWISHAPMHPVELRGFPSIHGHCHHNTTGSDPRYLNVCLEWLPNMQPMSLEQVRKYFEGANRLLGGEIVI